MSILLQIRPSPTFARHPKSIEQVGTSCLSVERTRAAQAEFLIYRTMFEMLVFSFTSICLVIDSRGVNWVEDKISLSPITPDRWFFGLRAPVKCFQFHSALKMGVLIHHLHVDVGIWQHYITCYKTKSKEMVARDLTEEC